MISLIGFIVGTYAVCRLIQVTLEFPGKSSWFGIHPAARWVLLASISCLGILFILALLSLMVYQQYTIEKDLNRLNNPAPVRF